MGRHTTLAKPAKKPPKREPAALDIDKELVEQMEFLKELQSAARLTLDEGNANPAMLRESAGLVRAIVHVAAEMRTREKSNREKLATLPPTELHTMVSEHIKGLDYEGRKFFADIFAEFATEEGLLS